jgi:hypothetical protein
MLEIIPDHDPFKPHRSWHELRVEFRDRVSTAVIEDASHALFPEQPHAVAMTVVPWIKKLLPSS